MTQEKYEQSLKGIHAVTVYCGSQSVANPLYDEAVVALGEFLAAHTMTLVFGGSNVGTMKLLADTVLKNGGNVVGVFTKNLPDGLLYSGLTEAIITETLAARKAEMIRRADALIALPGSFGTWDELFDALALRKITKGGHALPIGLLNVDGYYDALLKFIEHSIEVGFTTAQHAHLLQFAATPDKLFHQLVCSLPTTSLKEPILAL